MVYIDNRPFYEIPCMCGLCPFFLSHGLLELGRQSLRGTCILFELHKRHYDSPPRRCKKIFDKAFTFPEGTQLVITARERGD